MQRLPRWGVHSPGYWTFLLFAAVLVVVPGPDFAVVVRNTLAGGRARGLWSAFGVAGAAAVQGGAAAAGLGALVLRVEPVFQAIRWAGIGYLALLAVQALRSAVRGQYPPLDGGPVTRATAWAGWRQGFLSNITNPKVLVFYLAVLPQFLSPGAGLGLLLGYALSHAALGMLYLTALTLLLARARRLLSRRRVRRGLDALTGVALLGFGARLATERA
jgi:threonine/homoserine/homoserine lactone efflux protein